jgi:hypothetical protein
VEQIKLPINKFATKHFIEVIDANNNVVISWQGFDGTDFEMSTEKKFADKIVNAVNCYDDCIWMCKAILSRTLSYQELKEMANKILTKSEEK